MGSVPVSLEQLTRQILHTVLEAGVMVDAQIYSSFSFIVFLHCFHLWSLLCVFSLLLRVKREILRGYSLQNYRNVCRYENYNVLNELNPASSVRFEE